MSIDFLEELRKATKESFIDYLQTNKELFYTKLVESWGEEMLAKIQNAIMGQVKNNDFSIVDTKKTVKGVCDYISFSILTGEASQSSNAILKKEIEAQGLNKIFHPLFVKVGEHTEKKKFGTGFFNSTTEYWKYYEYTLELSALARRAIEYLEQRARANGIYLSKIGFDYYSSSGDPHMFDNLYKSSKRISRLLEDGKIDKWYEIEHRTYFYRMLIEYSVTY